MYLYYNYGDGGDVKHPDILWKYESISQIWVGFQKFSQKLDPRAITLCLLAR